MSTLRVGAALPNPPFNAMPGGGGLDVDLMSAIGAALAVAVEFVPYRGPDFDGIFAGLGTGPYDVVAAGTTVTPERERLAAFAPSYLVSGQALAVAAARLPNVRSIEDLAGLTIGVEHGDISRTIAEQLVAQGKAAAVRVYGYGGTHVALSDLTTGGCDAFMKLAPVLTEFVRPGHGVEGVEIVQGGLSREPIAIAVALGNTALRRQITAAQATLEEDGTLQRIRRRWLGHPYVDQSLAAL